MADGRVQPPTPRGPPRVLIIQDQMEIDNLMDDSNFATALTAARTNSRSQFFLSAVAGPVQWTLRVRQPTWRRVPAWQ
jgi:hypothetical protein